MSFLYICIGAFSLILFSLNCHVLQPLMLPVFSFLLCFIGCRSGVSQGYCPRSRYNSWAVSPRVSYTLSSRNSTSAPWTPWRCSPYVSGSRDRSAGKRSGEMCNNDDVDDEYFIEYLNMMNVTKGKHLFYYYSLPEDSSVAWVYEPYWLHTSQAGNHGDCGTGPVSVWIEC